MKIIRYDLERNAALSYFKEKLNTVNALSDQLLNMLNFSSGFFFTLLPQLNNKLLVDEFYRGGIAIGVREYTKSLILNMANIDRNFFCVFDDVLSEYTDTFNDELYKNYGMHYLREVYYLINSSKITPSLLSDCFYASDSIWHSMCILTYADCASISKELSPPKIQEICFKAELILLGAYDGEGFIFWEPAKKFACSQ